MLPDFDQKTGQLPPGIHQATWDEFVTRFGTNVRRRKLIDGLKLALDSLKHAGCKTAYVDGSFVTSKERPRDFDGCWDANGVDGDLLDPELLVLNRDRIVQKRSTEENFFHFNFRLMTMGVII
jgi:hypothetical protein